MIKKLITLTLGVGLFSCNTTVEDNVEPTVKTEEEVIVDNDNFCHSINYMSVLAGTTMFEDSTKFSEIIVEHNETGNDTLIYLDYETHNNYYETVLGPNGVDSVIIWNYNKHCFDKDITW